MHICLSKFVKIRKFDIGQRMLVTTVIKKVMYKISQMKLNSICWKSGRKSVMIFRQFYMGWCAAVYTSVCLFYKQLMTCDVMF